MKRRRLSKMASHIKRIPLLTCLLPVFEFAFGLEPIVQF